MCERSNIRKKANVTDAPESFLHDPLQEERGRVFRELGNEEKGGNGQCSIFFQFLINFPFLSCINSSTRPSYPTFSSHTPPPPSPLRNSHSTLYTPTRSPSETRNSLLPASLASCLLTWCAARKSASEISACSSKTPKS